MGVDHLTLSLFTVLPGQIFAKDLKPLTDGKSSNMEPEVFLEQKAKAAPAGTFDGVVSMGYAIAGINAFYGCDEDIIKQRIFSTYPDFYTPTWREYFDLIAQQMKAKWEWKEDVKQFEFCHNDKPPFFSVDLDPKWNRENRGFSVWHAPKDMSFGMNIYYFGHFTTPKDTTDEAFHKKIREYFTIAFHQNMGSPEIPELKDLKLEDVGGAKATFWQKKGFGKDPNSLWRQWAFVVDGHAFLAVNVIPKERIKDMSADVDKMLKTFKIEK